MKVTFVFLAALIVNVHGTTVSVSANVKVCNPPCTNGQGVCNENMGTCECNADFGGASCDVAITCGAGCQNGGLCMEVDGVATCVCPDTHTGENCETAYTCDPTPGDCGANGTCTKDINGTFSCECDSGAYGAVCDKTSGPDCSASNLNNCTAAANGTCVFNSDESDSECSCNDGYAGADCTRIATCNPGAMEDCGSNGICPGDALTCQCYIGYTGDTCDTAITSCTGSADASCSGFGYCPDEGVDCVCNAGYDPADGCASVLCTPTCENGGICVEWTDGTVGCNCNETGYRGDSCTIENVCDPVCQNGATCNLDGQSECDCSNIPYSGDACDIPECADCGLGVCVAVDPDTTECDCSGTGFSGDACTVPNVCAEVCAAYEVCDEDSTCQCPVGFEGDGCDVPICDPDCGDNGVCETGILGNVCACHGGYTGDDCSEEIVCTEPCVNDGYCEVTNEADGTTACNCDNTGFSGATCSEANTCDPECSGNTVCNDAGTCECMDGYEGEDCEDLVCDPVCDNGTCSDDDGVHSCDCKGTEFTGISCSVALSCQGACGTGICETADDGSAGCNCDGTGFSGIGCATANTCDPECVENAICTDTLECECMEGYAGDDCETVVCEPACENGGECVTDNNDDHVCDCQGTEYNGETCESALSCLDACNDGYCHDNEDGTAQCNCDGTGFTGDSCDTANVCDPVCLEKYEICNDNSVCECAEGYEGEDCMTLICDPVCKNMGECVEGNDNEHVCDCDGTGYGGDVCDEETTCDPACELFEVCNEDGSCSCPVGFSGDVCEIADPVCEPVCLFGGECVATEDDNVSCDCGGTGYSGDSCTQANTCDPACESYEVCGEENACECPRGYTGDLCDEKEDDEENQDVEDEDEDSDDDDDDSGATKLEFVAATMIAAAATILV